MPNHFHLLLHIKPRDNNNNNNNASNDTHHPVNQKVAVILRSYAQAINNQENRSGSLFQSRTEAKNLSNGDRNYGSTCFHYIHQNPLKAGLVSEMGAWPFFLLPGLCRNAKWIITCKKDGV
jgi:putative transposase